MPPTARSPFAQLLLLTGWSPSELAAQVNVATREVEAWQQGKRPPRGSKGSVLAEALSQRLGRPVSLEELRRRPTRTPGGHPSSHHDRRTAAKILLGVTMSDLMANNRGQYVTDDPPTLFPHLFNVTLPGEHPAPSPDQRELGETLDDLEVEQLERTVLIFRAWDTEIGGRLRRKAVVGQLNEIGGLLTQDMPPGFEGRIWHIASDLACLARSQAIDVGMEPLADRYARLSEITRRLGAGVLAEAATTVKPRIDSSPAHTMPGVLRGESVLRIAAWLLPENTRDAWFSEWAAELHAATSTRARLAYALSILVHAPALARIESGLD